MIPFSFLDEYRVIAVDADWVAEASTHLISTRDQEHINVDAFFENDAQLLAELLRRLGPDFPLYACNMSSLQQKLEFNHKLTAVLQSRAALGLGVNVDPTKNAHVLQNIAAALKARPATMQDYLDSGDELRRVYPSGIVVKLGDVDTHAHLRLVRLQHASLIDGCIRESSADGDKAQEDGSSSSSAHELGDE